MEEAPVEIDPMMQVVPEMIPVVPEVAYAEVLPPTIIEEPVVQYVAVPVPVPVVPEPLELMHLQSQQAAPYHRYLY